MSSRRASSPGPPQSAQPPPISATPSSASTAITAWRRDWTEALGDVFGLDLRSLALFRIALAVVLLYDLFVRWGDLEAHYTDAGVLPRTILPGYPGLLSYHTLVGSARGEECLFLIAGLFATCLLIGYRTWGATAFSWMLLLSLQARNPLVLLGGDVVLRLSLFWSLFLPLGAVWSVDAQRAARDHRLLSPEKRLITVGGAALILQICCIYWFSVYFKSGAAWHREGTAVYDALSLDQFATAIGKALLNLRWTGLLAFLTHAVVYFETFAPVLMLLPWRLGLLRTLLVLAFLCFHTGLALCLRIGPFPLVCSVLWLALLPTWFWERIAARTAKKRTRSTSGATASIPETQAESRRQRRRLWLGDSIACQVIAAFFLVYVLLWNLRTAANPVATALLAHADGIGQVARLDQEWKLFGPRPYVQDGWHVIAARLANGSDVDLLREAPLTWEKPVLVTAIYKDELWRKYLDHLRDPDYVQYRPYYAAYMARTWDCRHRADQHVVAVALYFMEEDVRPNYRPRTIHPLLLYRAAWGIHP